MVLRWRSEPIGERALPARLHWQDEEPNADYRCRVALATDDDGRTYRRVTFPDGSRIFSELRYLGEVPATVR